MGMLRFFELYYLIQIGLYSKKVNGMAQAYTRSIDEDMDKIPEGFMNTFIEDYKLIEENKKNKIRKIKKINPVPLINEDTFSSYFNSFLQIFLNYESDREYISSNTFSEENQPVSFFLKKILQKVYNFQLEKNTKIRNNIALPENSKIDGLDLTTYRDEIFKIVKKEYDNIDPNDQKEPIKYMETVYKILEKEKTSLIGSDSEAGTSNQLNNIFEASSGTNDDKSKKKNKKFEYDPEQCIRLSPKNNDRISDLLGVKNTKNYKGTKRANHDKDIVSEDETKNVGVEQNTQHIKDLKRKDKPHCSMTQPKNEGSITSDKPNSKKFKSDNLHKSHQTTTEENNKTQAAYETGLALKDSNKQNQISNTAPEINLNEIVKNNEFINVYLSRINETNNKDENGIRYMIYVDLIIYIGDEIFYLDTVLNHIKGEGNSGHYFTYNLKDGIYFRCNDNNIKEIKRGEIYTKNLLKSDVQKMCEEIADHSTFLVYKKKTKK